MPPLTVPRRAGLPLLPLLLLVDVAVERIIECNATTVGETGRARASAEFLQRPNFG